MKFLSTLAGALFIIILLVFSLSNRQKIDISLWPFDAEISMPVFLVVLGAWAIGLIIGSFWVWAQHIPHRRRARRLGKDIAALNDRLLEAEQKLDQQRVVKTTPTLPFLARPRWRFWQRP